MARARGHVLAVDVGSSVIRVSAVAANGTVVASARAPTQPHVAGDTAVVDARALWRDLVRLIDEVVAVAGRPSALGVACQLATAFLDAQLEPVAPVLLWQDRRAAPDAADLETALGDDALRLAGRRPAPEAWAARGRWLARTDHAAWARTRWVCTLKDALVAWLTGHLVTDPTSASYSLLFDVAERQWSADLANAVGFPPERLPPIVAATDVPGPVSGSAGLGGLAGAPVAAGGPDGSVAALGCGAARPGITVDVAGTTDVLLHVVDRPILDPNRRTVLNAFLVPGLWTVGGPTGLTGGAIPWLADLLGYPTVDEAYVALAPALAQIPAGADGLAFNTALTGERFPRWKSSTNGSLVGLRPEHTAAHLLRAAEEGAAFAVLEGLEAIEAIGVRVGDVRVTGGVARRPDAIDLRANAWQRRVVPVADGEATTTGAAMLAAVASGLAASLDDAATAMVRLEPPVGPHSGLATAYREAYERWRQRTS